MVKEIKTPLKTDENGDISFSLSRMTVTHVGALLISLTPIFAAIAGVVLFVDKQHNTTKAVNTLVVEKQIMDERIDTLEGVTTVKQNTNRFILKEIFLQVAPDKEKAERSIKALEDTEATNVQMLKDQQKAREEIIIREAQKKDK